MAVRKEEVLRTQSTAVRHRRIAQDRGTKIHPGVPPRTSRRANNGASSQRALRPVYPYTTAGDDELLESTTQPPIPLGPRVQALLWEGFLKRCLKNRLVVILLTILVVLAFWWSTTAFWGWVVMHFDDPGRFGPTHGNSINVVLGGGDSADHPSKLIAINNGGLVEIVKIPANDPTKPHANDPTKSQLLTVANLATSGFPNPTEANIELRVVGDHIEMTILSTVWNFPGNRVQQTVSLVEDGNGGLKGPQQ